MSTKISMETETDAPILFTAEPSQHLKCPVCQRLYTEPVINIVCGHTFCKACAESTDTCPTDGSTCDPKQVVINRLVIGQIEDLHIYCRFGVIKENNKFVQDPSGCQQKIQLGTRSSHEDNCEFRPVNCSNKSCGARLRQCELQEHLKICEHTKCQHSCKGCEFQGRREEVSEHEQTCGYRGLQAPAGSGNMETMEIRAQELEDTNRQLQNQVNQMSTKIIQLEESTTVMQGDLKGCLGCMKELQLKYDTLSATVDQLMTIRNRRSFGSPAHVADGRPRSASSSFRRSFSGSPPSSGKFTKWAMPFQFKCIGTLRGHQDVVWCMVAKNKKLYTAGSDCLIKVWDLENLQRGCVKTIQGHTKAIQCMAMSNIFLYTGGHDNTICCWNLEDYTVVSCVKNAHDNIISSMVIAGDYLFTSSFSLIKIWDAKTLTIKDTITGLHHWVRALSLNPDRDKLFSGSHNTINIWSVVEPFALKGKVDHQFGSVHSLAITDKYIIAGSYRGRDLCDSLLLRKFLYVQLLRQHNKGTYNHNIQIFDCKTRQHTKQLVMHIGLIQSLVTSHCGGFLFSASVDNSIQIWNLENMLPTQTLQRHEGSVNSLVLYNDFLFSGSEDKEIKVFMYFQMQMGFAIKP